MLICEGEEAKRVLQESKKLNMVNGDFVWLWIDTSAMLLKDKSIKLEKTSREIFASSYGIGGGGGGGGGGGTTAETRKVRHAPNFYEANQSGRTNATSNNLNNNVNANNNINKNRDNNAIVAGALFCNNTNRSVLYENKTEPKTLYNNVINLNNEVLPNFRNQKDVSSLNTLMKHHFSLYRKKAWKVSKEEAAASKRAAAAAAVVAPTAVTTAATAANVTHLSVINDDELNHSEESKASPPPPRFNSSHHTLPKYKRNSGAQNLSSSPKTTDDIAELVKRKAHMSSSSEQYNYGVPIFLENNSSTVLKNKTVPEMPVGVLALQLMPLKVDKNYVKSTLRLLISTLKEVIVKYGDKKLSKLLDLPRISCFDFVPVTHGPNSIMDELTQ